MDYAFAVYVEDKRNNSVYPAGRFWTREEADIERENALAEKLQELCEEGYEYAETVENEFFGYDIIAGDELLARVTIDEEPCG